MIITRYLVREIFKSQFAILFILFFIFFCQKLVRILGAVVNGSIPKSLIFSLLGLGVPEMAQLILPLSLFLGLLITLSRLYNGNEITVMHACGLGKNVLIQAILMLILITTLFAAINVIWLSPLFSRYQNKILSEVKANPSMAILVEGQFNLAENGKAVLFVNNVKGKQFQKIFLAQLKESSDKRSLVLIADQGHINLQPDGSQLILLNEGTLYEGTAPLSDFTITNFTQYQVLINHHVPKLGINNVEQMNLYQLCHSTRLDALAELHWRLTLVVSVLIMATIVVPLSVVNLHTGRIVNILLAMLLYLIFFILQISIRFNGAKGKLDPMIWMWFINLIYLTIALIMNLWGSVPVRKLRSKLLYTQQKG